MVRITHMTVSGLYCRSRRPPVKAHGIFQTLHKLYGRRFGVTTPCYMSRLSSVAFDAERPDDGYQLHEAAVALTELYLRDFTRLPEGAATQDNMQRRQ